MVAQTEQIVGDGIEQNVEIGNVNATLTHVNLEHPTDNAPPLVDENVELLIEDHMVPLLLKLWSQMLICILSRIGKTENMTLKKGCWRGSVI